MAFARRSLLAQFFQPLADGADVLAHGAFRTSAHGLARLRRVARLHPLQNVLVEQVAEGAVDGEVDAVERLVVFDAVAHDLARHAVRVAEGHAFLRRSHLYTSHHP